MLADEVGLGKTIEACMILKQFIMDFPQNHKTLIIVPPTLLNQWKNELISRFHLLDDNNNKNIWLLSYNELDFIEDNISSAKMIIVDEAHNINNLYNTKLYNLLETYTGNLNKLFLLSATPVYNNEKNYFDMLHLLDPVVYQKNNFENFQLLLKNRQGLEEAISSLRPENLFNLDMVLDQLTEINHQDKKLNQMINKLKDKILLTVDENDEDYQLQLNNLEKYLTETYKLDRRIISTKREDIKYETKRRGVEFIDFEFDYVKKLLDAIDELRISIKLKQLDQKYKNFLLKLFYYSNQRILNNQIVDDLLDNEDIEFDENDLHHLNQIKKSYEIINDNSFLIYEEVEGIINSNYGKSKRYIIFCTSDEDARGLFLFLKEKFPKYVTIIFREKNQFSIDQIDILICKQGAEEGLNLQGKDRALIFFDLPFNANRIEQRIGRVDRFGSEIFEIYVLRNKSNYFELMWSKFLDEDLKIFNESISGLQVFLENEINNLFDNFISEGIDAFHNFFENLTGENNKLEKEIQFLNRRARLRTVNEITDERIDQLIKFDQDYLEIKNSMMSWFCDTLKIGNDDKSIKYIVSLKSDLNHVDDLIQKYSNKNLTLQNLTMQPTVQLIFFKKINLTFEVLIRMIEVRFSKC